MPANSEHKRQFQAGWFYTDLTVIRSINDFIEYELKPVLWYIRQAIAKYRFN